MQAVVIDKPYQFVPPHRGTFWIKLLGRLLPRHLRRKHGIESYECRGLEHLQHSFAQKHGILLTPNHCRPSDPMLMGVISRAVASIVAGVILCRFMSQRSRRRAPSS